MHVLNIAVSMGFTTLLFAMIFNLMPTTPIAWRDVWVGAFVTAALFDGRAAGGRTGFHRDSRQGAAAGRQVSLAGALLSNRRKGLQKKVRWATRAN